MALSQDTVIELGLFLGCIVLLVVMLKLLIDLARKQMIPRPVFVKPDRFRNYEEEQNWSWDFVFVFHSFTLEPMQFPAFAPALLLSLLSGGGILAGAFGSLGSSYCFYSGKRRWLHD